MSERLRGNPEPPACPCWRAGDGGQCSTCGEVQMERSTISNTYARDYERGWRRSVRVGSLDGADDDGRTSIRAWMDGYADQAAGREKWHLRDCPNHEECR